MSALDWTEFFESVSLVDEVLRAGPNYAAMDFATRDAYRHAIEELARGSGRPELDVAREAMAQRAPRERRRRRSAARSRLLPHRRRAPGLRAGARLPGAADAPAASRLRRGARRPAIWERSPSSAAPCSRCPCCAAWASGVGPVGLARARAPGPRPGLGPGDRAAESQRHRRWSRRTRCRGSSCATGCRRICARMVVVPMLLTDRAEVEEQIERLEVHYLANPDGDVRFAVLSDWTDAPAESVPGDDETLAAAREGIARLNRASRRHAGWRRAIPALPPPAALERERADVDGMGAQAGQAPRAEPPPARRDRHELRAHGRRRAVRRPLRHHARRRHAAAPGRGRAAGRHDGASPQPAAVRSRTAPRRRGLRRAAAARDAAAARARGLALPASVVGPGRHRPVRGGGVRRVPGSLAGRARTPARASTTSTRSRRRWPDACRRTRC